jgi:hypothetical protein
MKIAKKSIILTSVIVITVIFFFANNSISLNRLEQHKAEQENIEHLLYSFLKL